MVIFEVTKQMLQDWLLDRNRNQRWQKHFAWLPVTTIGGKRIWMKTVYKRKQFTEAIAVDNEAYWWQYADFFEMLANI
jgi:hypothetical protein